jgi:hypothetical protein
MVKNSNQSKTHLPHWSPRLPQGKIRRLYELDAAGIYDDDLINEIGWGLRARCESFVTANNAVQGKAACPVCSTLIEHHSTSKFDRLTCPSCNWSASWGEYFGTIQHKQLSGAEPVLALFRSFIDDFPLARTPAEKMFLIDRLVHGFHYYGKTTTRPVAINLIEGRLNEVIDFLDSLSYGESSTNGLLENRQDWVEKSQNARNWGK